MEAEPEMLVCFPAAPEYELFNREQRRLLKLASTMKERQIEARQRHERARRERAGKGRSGSPGGSTPEGTSKG
jgi:hypothetical protein